MICGFRLAKWPPPIAGHLFNLIINVGTLYVHKCNAESPLTASLSIGDFTRDEFDYMRFYVTRDQMDG